MTETQRTDMDKADQSALDRLDEIHRKMAGVTEEEVLRVLGGVERRKERAKLPANKKPVAGEPARRRGSVSTRTP
jgi:hypothetical protein